MIRQKKAGDQKAKPPSGYHSGKVCRQPPPCTPAGLLPRRFSQCRFPPGCRGAGGGAPGEIKLKSPPSPPGEGVGGMGAIKH